MLFTIVFGGTSPNSDYPRPTYHLVFHPAPVWMVDSLESENGIGDHALPSYIHVDKSDYNGPEYRIGNLQPLLLREGLSVESNPNVAVCVQPGGHGTKEDLQRLISDLQNYNFETTIVRMDE